MAEDGWRVAGLAALSATGGAAVVLLGAASAHAGDAEAVGNTSDVAGAQALDVAPGAGPTVADLDATVVNGGAAGANTGVNGAEEVEITTGHARSHGNEAQSEYDQSASRGAGGGLVVIDQDAGIANLGASWADTGFNDGAAIDTGDAIAWGNRSWSKVGQSAVVLDTGDAVAFVRQAAVTVHLGAALAATGGNTGGDITTGLATAGGNEARTSTSQAAAVTGDHLGAAVIDQRARTRNRGGALAITGLNDGADGSIDTGDASSWGNRSWSSATQTTTLTDTEAGLVYVGQRVDIDDLGVGIAQTGLNDGGDTSTGNASAGGSDARTTAAQAADLTGDDPGPAVVEQRSVTSDRGLGIANTGRNLVVGDDSTNVPEV